MALIAMIAPSNMKAQDAKPVPLNPSGFVVHRGVNLSHWLSQDFGFCAKEAWITQNDITFIARTGFDHVRLPVDEKELWNVDGTKNEAHFAMLRQAIEWCRAEHLRVIVDIHTLRSHHFSASEGSDRNTLFTDPKAQAHLTDLWRDLSACLSDIPNDELAYEIMNEPVAKNPEDWNHVVEIAVKSIREKEANRVIVIGANMWQTPQNFQYLKTPKGDRNIILSFHTYEPLMFTHHNASWIEGPIRDYKGTVNYPGQIIDEATYEQLASTVSKQLPHPLSKNVLDDWRPERFLKEIKPAIDKAKELNLQLYCGEFGCMPTVPRASRLAYYRDIVGVFEANGIAWANWEYKGDFGIYEWHGEKYLTGAPDMEMIDALMQKPCCMASGDDR